MIKQGFKLSSAIILAIGLSTTSMVAHAIAPQAVKQACSHLQGTHIYPQGNGAYLCLFYNSETDEYAVIGTVYENGGTEYTVIHELNLAKSLIKKI